LYFQLGISYASDVAAWDVLKKNGKALDAVEAGVLKLIQKSEA
jgi:isoaspartyl peptidase/L-asparaginase-like protein (Ntn-hydrolase superfamily)